MTDTSTIETLPSSPMMDDSAKQLRYILSRRPRRVLVVAECEHEGDVEILYREGGWSNTSLYEKFIKDGLVGVLSENAQMAYYNSQE